jgi:signal transduction histidine kinase
VGRMLLSGEVRTIDGVSEEVPWWVWLVGVAAVVTGIGVIGTIHVEPDAGQRATDALAYVLVGVCGAALLLRRWWPLATLVIVTAGLAVYILRDYPGGPIYLIGLVALFSYASARERRAGYIAAVAMVAVLGGLRYAVDPGFGVDDLALVGLSAVAVLAADAMRGRRERVASRLERRLAEDRLQIARDLHDSVAHSMATINVQAGVAAHVIDRHPEQAAAALEAIRVASRDVLDELAAMLSVLRDETPAARHPTPDLTSLAELVESSGRAGLHVDLQVSGDLDAVPPAVSTAAYRIVQEALTNVARHASTNQAVVTVARRPDGQLDAEVTDRGHGVAVAGNGGRGLQGIQERATTTGGLSTIGPRPGGGFAVSVSWPGRA